ncbi:MAG: glycosyl transferase family 1 [Blastocatellia bacterium AA13]|nr:MAG: glycosyl transferase family 1 [Blastocatellia bacterium AA13]
MRVTIIGPAYPLRGGIAHHVFWLWKELTARSHAVQVISFKRLYPAFLFPGKVTTDASELKLDAEAEALLDPLNPLTWLRALNQTREFDPELVIIQWWNTFFAPVTGILSGLFEAAGIRVLLECHNILPHEDKWFDFALAGFAFLPVDRFITHSEADLNTLLTIRSDAVVRVAPLPSIDQFAGKSRPDRRGRNILFFGLVRKYKGLEVLLRAMPAVLARFDCRLRIVGEFYDPASPYRKLIEDLGLESRVEIEDRYIANEEVGSLFDWADVLVLPYLSATQSGVARIALSNRLPVIASRTGGLQEIIIDQVNGLMFSPGDERELAKALIRYFAEGLGPLLAAGAPSLETNVEEFLNLGL